MEHDYIFKYIRTTDERSELINLVEKLIENNFKSKPDPLDQSPFSQKSSELIFIILPLFENFIVFSIIYNIYTW